jgi:hypothetical protein
LQEELIQHKFPFGAGDVFSCAKNNVGAYRFSNSFALCSADATALSPSGANKDDYLFSLLYQIAQGGPPPSEQNSLTAF